jgi:hypothetical protein
MRKMRHLIFGTAVLTLAIVGMGQTTKPLEVENYLQNFNPGFEEPVRNGVLSGWKPAYGTWKVVDDAKGGKKSLWIVGNSKIYSNKLIRVEPGYKYHMSAWGKIKNFKFIKEGFYGVGIGLELLDGQKQIQGNWYNMYGYLKYEEGDKGWEFSGGPDCPPKESTVYLRPAIFVWAAPGSEVWVDDVRVWKEKLPEMKAEGVLNLVENGSFEIRYEMEKRANGFSFADQVGKNAICVEDVRHSGLASMRMTGECTAYSGIELLDIQSARAGIALKTDNVTGGKAFANLLLYDRDRKKIKTLAVATLRGTNEWNKYSTDLKTIDPAVRYAQWEFGLEKGTKGTVWFDDLEILVPTTYKPFPRREKNTVQAHVTVDCSVKKGVFTSPLNAYDHHNSDRVYSSTIGTAGKFVDGPGHWYQERPRLGFKYVRIHHIYQNNICNIKKGKDGKGGVDFCAGRTNWPESDKGFAAIVSFDKDGKMTTDFSAIKYMLDKSLLVGGCKPIIGLEPVPNNMARDWNTHNGPANYKDWEELNYRFIKYLVETYGKEEVKTWMFETANEPGTEPEWHGFRTDPKDSFLKMQDYTVAGCVRAFPEIFIAGPSGCAGDSSMEEMLDHCADGINAATGKKGTKIDAISYHGYLSGYSGDISWRQAEDQIIRNQGYIDRFYKKTGKRLMLFNTEYTPIFFDGGRDPKSPTHEQNNHIQAIATLHTGYFSHRLGVSLMAFFFQSPIYFGYADDPSIVPEFQGLPTCITFHGFFNPVCRAHQMMSWLNGGMQVSAEADKDPVYSLAVVDKNQIKVLCYSFEANPQVKYTTAVDLSIDPAGLGKTFKVTRYELSKTKANSWYLAQKIRLTQADCIKNPSLVDKLNKDSELKPENAGMAEVRAGKIVLKFELPAYSASLYVLEKLN